MSDDILTVGSEMGRGARQSNGHWLMANGSVSANGSVLRSRRAQLRIFETLAVLVIFFFFIAFGMNVYFVVQRAGIEKEIERVQDLRSVQVAQKAMSLPELDCVVVGVQREYCFDALKLDAVRSVVASPSVADVYVPVFGYSTVSVTRFTPSRQSWSVYDRRRPGDERRFQAPVLIYDPVRFSYGFGMLEVTVYG